MDASILTNPDFWDDSKPSGFGILPDLPELTGHVMFETSGTSGNPKSVALSKQALLISAAAVNEHLQATPSSRWGLALPLKHVGGFGVAARAYQAQCKFYQFDRRWDPAFFTYWIDELQISHTSLVPTQVHDLVQAGMKAPTTLRAVVVGGGSLDARIGNAARDLGWPVLASYGMTEASSQIATQALDSLNRPYECSPVPLLPIWEARTTPENILSISGPALFSGYISSGVFYPRDTPWFVTSDRVYLQDRLITPIGRVDTLVKILGELVDPDAIEKELLELSNFRLTPRAFAVVAIPDERTGFLLVPFFDTTVSQAVIDETLSIYQSNAPGFRRLKSPILLANLPRTELGKLRRNTLIDLYHSHPSARGQDRQ